MELAQLHHASANYCTLVKEGPWAVHFMYYGSDGGGGGVGADIQGINIV